MTRRIIVPLFGSEVAPRFDLAHEVLTAKVSASNHVFDEKVLVLAEASADRLCHMIISEENTTVICGGIEQEHLDYLVWKQIEVIDNVIGPSDEALRRFANGKLAAGDILK